jgi:type I restriction enzyme R subunit
MSYSPEYQYSELPAIELFQKLGYQYFDGALHDERTDITEVVLKGRLLQTIQRINPWINESNLQKAYDRITSVQGTSLMEINQQVWELIKGDTLSLKQVVGGKEDFHPVSFIDYQNPENNDFLVVNQLRVHGRMRNSIPDLIVFVNGLPIAVLECKSPIAANAFDKAYSDLQFYQENSEKLFHHNQICAGIYQVGGRYGAICSPQAFYSVFRTRKDEEVAGIKTEQDKLIYNLFEKERLLDIIRHFVIFELEEGRTIKKLPRYQQIRATNNTIAKLQQGQGGVVWHTQGSGKSITMAYVTRKLQAPEYGFDNPTVIVMTDRIDLDRQITGTFRAVGFKSVHQASSVAHLDKLLRNDYGGIITTTLQKFQERDRDASEAEDQTTQDEHENLLIEKEIRDGVLTKITKALIAGKWVEQARELLQLEQLSQKENLYVLVDEAHRSQYGFLAAFMRTVLPHAKFVAFTGTPISKEDKSTLGEFYGGNYLDVYTIKESVADGATVELLYDEGIAKLDVKKKELDTAFAARFGHLSEEKQYALKQKALKKYALSWERITDITKHVITHFRSKIHPDGHKAMLVCDGRHAAIRYKQVLEKLKEEGFHDYETKVVVSIGSPKADTIAKDYYETLEWNWQHPDQQKPVWVVAPEEIKATTDNYKLPYGNVDDKEKSGKRKYDNTAILIVSDMLLTGYDAPIASCLYLDKPLKEHNLLQAIARVNRSGRGKVAGYIVDYNGISAHLIQALEIFSGDLRPDDILKNINEELPKLEMNHTKLVEHFKGVKWDRAYNRADFIDEAVRFIEPVDVRDKFLELLKAFNKSISIVLPNTRAMRFFEDFKVFNEIRMRAKNIYIEGGEDLKVSKEESLLLQRLIDEHLRSEGVESLLKEPISIIDKDRFRQEILNASPATRELKMRNNLKHVIKVGLDKSPDFYRPLAERLEELLRLQKEQRITQLELLKMYADIQDDIVDHQSEGKEKGFQTERQQAVYDSMKTIFNGDAEDATRTLFDLIGGELSIVGWEGKGMVLKDIENKLTRFLKMKMERTEAKAKAMELIDVIKRNKDA